MKEITVDIDENFDEWKHDRLAETREKIANCVDGVSRRYIRRSSGGHVHIRLVMDRDIDLLKSFAIRAFLDDDPHRLACDLCRFYTSGEEKDTGRCFDEKYKRGEKRIAGKWERF